MEWNPSEPGSFAQVAWRADRDRAITATTAPSGSQEPLLRLYAFNADVTQIPWVAKERLRAEIRNILWLDSLEKISKGHVYGGGESAWEMADSINKGELDPEKLIQIALARKWDIYSEPHESLEGFWKYLRATSGLVMGQAALALGGCGRAVEIAELYGTASGLASYFEAVPGLLRAGKAPLVSYELEDLRALAVEGIEMASLAREEAKAGPAPHPLAMIPGCRAESILAKVAKRPERVLAGRLGEPDASRKTALLMRCLTGKW